MSMTNINRMPAGTRVTVIPDGISGTVLRSYRCENGEADLFEYRVRTDSGDIKFRYGIDLVEITGEDFPLVIDGVLMDPTLSQLVAPPF